MEITTIKIEHKDIILISHNYEENLSSNQKRKKRLVGNSFFLIKIYEKVIIM